MQIINSIILQLQTQNQEVLKKIKESRKNPILSIFVHPISRTLVNEVYDIIKSPQFVEDRKLSNNQDNLDVIIDSGGGDADAAYHIAKLLHQNFSGDISYIIPRYAKSAATLLISGGDKIIMNRTSELGPLDPQIKQPDGSYISAKSVESTLELIKSHISSGGDAGLKLATVISARINPLLLGQYQSTVEIGKKYQAELLSLRMFSSKTKDSKKAVDKIVKRFALSYTHHARVIDCYEAKEIFGEDKVEILDGDVWDLIWRFYENSKATGDLVNVLKILEKQNEII